MPFFSVVIPLYNKEKYIQNTLQSVLNQNFADFEIIIINDGSTDESEAIVKQFQDTRIRYFITENCGAGAARNTGIDQAIAPYIAFLDADDLWFTNHLEELKKLIYEFPNAGIYTTRYKLEFKNGSTMVPKFNGLTRDYKGYVADYFYSTQNNSLVTSITCAIPKTIFETIGNFNTSITSGQDNDMWLRIALKYTVVIGNQITAQYLQYINDSLSKTHILKKTIKPFDSYAPYEKENPSLKKYLDIYRLEYALKYKMAGAHKEAQKLYKDILKDNIPLKSKLLFHLPSRLLSFLLMTKRKLKDKGIDFSIYR
jgi:glycosyltransferase involved in cell wall biosynthesis